MTAYNMFEICYANTDYSETISLSSAAMLSCQPRFREQIIATPNI